MGHRFFASVSAAASAIALLMTPSPVAGQATRTSKTWTPPRTIEGQPDLQGFWTNSTLTPLERPRELANKEFFTSAEAAIWEKQRLVQENS